MRLIRSSPMRITLWLYLLCLAYPISASAQHAEWTPVFRTYNTFLGGMDCRDALHCVVAGNDTGLRTLLYRTSDGGITWDTLVVDDGGPGYLPAYPKSVSYPSENVIVIGSDSGFVWVSTDAGTSFRKSALGLDGWVESVEMLDEQHGVACGMLGMFYTSDAWTTTNRLQLPDSLSHMWFADIKMSPGGMMWALVGHRIDRRVFVLSKDRTEDEWTVRSVPEDNYGMEVSADGLLVVCGYRIADSTKNISRSYISVSRDSGKTWVTSLDSLAWPYGGIADVSFANRSLGVATGPGGMVWSTTDGAVTWSRDTLMGVSGLETGFVEARCVDDGTCLAAMGMDVITKRSLIPAVVEAGSVQIDNRRLSYRMSGTTDELVFFVGGNPHQHSNILCVDLLGRPHSIESSRRDRSSQSEWIVRTSNLERGTYIFYLEDSPFVACVGQVP